MEDGINVYAIRLKPGMDLKQALQDFINLRNISAGWIMSCVGSLTRYHLRFANQENGHMQNGFFEITSLTGTISVLGNHLHMAVSDNKGSLIGGHVLDGCTIYTTAEVIIGEINDLVFDRVTDESTGWKELAIRKAGD
jgi:predicted DNA-binding protein with PD1-like motif